MLTCPKIEPSYILVYYGLPLQLGHTIDIQIYGLGCLLKVQCLNTSCMHVNSVPTGKRHDRVLDVNSKLATALVHSGLGERQAHSFLSELNIPAFSYKLVSARLREVGNVVEEVAKESTNEALEKELAAVEQKKGKLVVAADAGWQKRGNGRAYDSKSGKRYQVLVKKEGRRKNEPKQTKTDLQMNSKSVNHDLTSILLKNLICELVCR